MGLLDEHDFGLRGEQAIPNPGEDAAKTRLEKETINNHNRLCSYCRTIAVTTSILFSCWRRRGDQQEFDGNGNKVKTFARRWDEATEQS